MNVLSMAVRNLGRNRRRTSLAVLSVLIAIALVVFMDGLIGGILDSMARNFTKNETGHVSVTTAAYRARERFMPVSAAMKDTDVVADAIRATPGLQGRIVQAAPRALFGVVLSSASATKAARGIGGDPEMEKHLLMLDRAVLPGGAYLDRPGSAIVGARLAEDLGLRVGDPLKVVCEKADYGMGFKKFRISGVFRTGVDTFDASTFLVGLDDARELLGLGRGASQILVMLKDYRDSDAAARLISAHLAAAGLGKLSVESWTALGDVAALISLSARIYLWGEILVALLGAFIIANIMVMVVLERRHEIGLLKSMGMEGPRILGLFLTAGMLLGLIGSGAGAILGTALNAWLSVQGLDFTSSVSGSGIAMDNVIYTGVHPLHVVLLFLLGVAVSAGLSFLPSRGAARLDPVEAIRSV